MLQGITKTKDSQAVINYISKYISTQSADGRFFGQKRYFCSRNLKPHVVLRNRQAIAKLRNEFLPPFKIDSNTFYPDFTEYLYYETYYLGEGKSILSLPLDEATRNALELAAQGDKSTGEPVPYIEPTDLPSLFP